MSEETDEALAERVAGLLSCKVNQLRQQPLKDIIQALADYNEIEALQIIRRLAKARYIPESYVDDANALFNLGQIASLKNVCLLSLVTVLGKSFHNLCNFFRSVVLLYKFANRDNISDIPLGIIHFLSNHLCYFLF
jgi:hypothetical protein